MSRDPIISWIHKIVYVSGDCEQDGMNFPNAVSLVARFAIIANLWSYLGKKRQILGVIFYQTVGAGSRYFASPWFAWDGAIFFLHLLYIALYRAISASFDFCARGSRVTHETRSVDEKLINSTY